MRFYGTIMFIAKLPNKHHARNAPHPVQTPTLPPPSGLFDVEQCRDCRGAAYRTELDLELHRGHATELRTAAVSRCQASSGRA